jgi:subtilisin family serine protease/subtilase family serine protease
MRLCRILVAFALAAVASAGSSAAQTAGGGRFVAGQILVKFQPGANAASRADVHRQAGGTLRAEIARTGVQLVSVPAGDESAAINRYRRNPNVVYAEPNFIRSIPEPSSHAPGSQVVPGDRYFDQEWGLHNAGQPFYCIPWISGEICFYVGTSDADIDAPEAWALSMGASNVTVAVIDSGVDYTHPDLAANFAGGRDFVSPDFDPMDDHGHGTHVAGIIAAAMNNPTGDPAEEEGVVGVAPNARLLAYKVCRADGSCSDFAVEQALAQAIADGANVINMSLGDPAYSQSLYDAVQDAWNAGLVVVAAAGNNGNTDPVYPAAFDNVVSVAAFDEDHQRATFTSYGSWVDLSAPGNAIVSAYPMSKCSASAVPGDTGCYAWLSGTSMAAPHVAGAAALLWSRGDVTNNSQVVDILLQSADTQGAGSVRLDTWTQRGGLNLHDAFSYGVTNLPPVADAGADQALTDDDGDGVVLVPLDGSASSDSDGSIVSYEWREGSTVLGTGATTSVWLPVGTHTLTLEVRDDLGGSATDSVVVTIDPPGGVALVTVTASTPQANEAGPVSGVFTFSRTGDTSAALTVHYTPGGSAVADTDYASLPGIVTFAAGSATATVVVTPIDDVLFESDETVTLAISADAAYSIGSPSGATVTIVSDDPPPDLIVASVSAPSTGGADADIAVTDTTTNQGAGTSTASSTGFYLSSNTTLDAADVFLGSRAVPELGPGATHALSTTLHLPASAATGSYYVLAKADWDGATQESVETNNVRASGAIKIGPDLIVSAFTAPGEAAAGGTIVVSDTTRNQGAGTAASTTTRFYLSANSFVDAADVVLGDRTVPLLGAGVSNTVSTSLAIPGSTAAGTYFVIAQADGPEALAETAENNNKRTSVLRVGPDLIVSAIAAPSSAVAGATIAVSDTTKNQGGGSASESSTGFYLSLNTTWDAADVFLGSRPVGTLAPDATAAASTFLQIPDTTEPGSYYIIAAADWTTVVGETVESNNTKYSGAMTMGGDLTVSALSAPGTAVPGGPITVTDTTRNSGSVSMPQSETGFYLSLNTVLDPSDVFLGSRAVPPLGPSASDAASTELVLPAGTVPGLYYVFGVADWNGAVSEGLESNNSRRSGTIRIGPDLVVTILNAPSSAVAGSSITVSDTTKNQGGETAPASGTSYYLSVNSQVDGGDVLLATRDVAALAPGQSQAGSVSVQIPAGTAPGKYYLVAKADGPGALAEAQETNNTRGRAITITAP